MTEEPRNLPAIPDRDDVARDIHYETSLDEAEPSGPPLYVDLTRPGWTRLPIVPEQLRRDNIRATVARVGGRHWHAARFHGLRVARCTCSWPSRGRSSACCASSAGCCAGGTSPSSTGCARRPPPRATPASG